MSLNMFNAAELASTYRTFAVDLAAAAGEPPSVGKYYKLEVLKSTAVQKGFYEQTALAATVDSLKIVFTSKLDREEIC